MQGLGDVAALPLSDLKADVEGLGGVSKHEGGIGLNNRGGVAGEGHERIDTGFVAGVAVVEPAGPQLEGVVATSALDGPGRRIVAVLVVLEQVGGALVEVSGEQARLAGEQQ